MASEDVVVERADMGGFVTWSRGARALATGAMALATIAFSYTNAAGGELAEFNATVADAYAHYRSATFYLRTENLALAAIELEDMADKWIRVTARFGDAPPDAFSDDPEWRATLDAISARIADGVTAIDADDRAAAQNSLAPIRNMLSALRRRNHIEVFSDCVNELDAAVRALWTYRNAPPNFDAMDEVSEVRGHAAVVAYLLARCRERASAAHSGNAEFQDILAGSLDATDRLRDAIERKSSRDFINNLRELFSFNQMIFLRFG